MRVGRADVYRNLHADPPAWSVRDKSTGRVVGHSISVVVTDATFVVSVAGQQRVRRERQKNVHAFVRGTVEDLPHPVAPEHEGWHEVTYNPYLFDTFVLAANYAPLLRARAVWLAPTMRVWALLYPEDRALLALPRAPIPADRLAMLARARNRTDRGRHATERP